MYTGTTGKDGTATVPDMDLGAYLAVETKPAAEHFASTPFLFMLPYTTGGTTWTYGVSAQPKPLPAGDLVLKKTVTGTAGDTKKDFTFVVTFSKDGTYHYTKSDGTKGTVKSGGSVKLKSGETATIRDADPEQDGLSDTEDHDVHADHAVRPDARAAESYVG